MRGVPIPTRQLAFAAVAVGVATLVFVSRECVSWLGSWGETSASLDISTRLTYPLVAGLAAWFGSSARRQHYRWMIESAARPRYALHLRSTNVVASMAASGFLCVALLAVTATATQATFGRFPVVDLFTVVAGFFAAAGFGTLVATALPPTLAPVSALVLVYAVEAVADAGKPSLRPLAGLLVADDRDRTLMSTATWMLGLRGVWLVAVALVLVALAARAGSRAFLPFAVACLTATPLLLVGNAGMTIDAAAEKPVCHHPRTDVTVCLSAAMDHAYPAVWSALSPELDLLAGLAGDWRFDETTVARQMTPSVIDGTVTVPFETANGHFDGAHVVAPADFRSTVSDSVLQNNCGSSGDYTGRRPLADPEDVIQAWLLSQLEIPIDGDSPYDPHLSSAWLDYAGVKEFQDRWTGMTPAERQAWFSVHGPDVVQCQLGNVDVMHP